MAESLGEVFVEVLADASPFGDSLESGISDALQTVESEIAETFDSVEDAASAAFSSVSDDAGGAASESASAFDEATSEIQSSIDTISFDDVIQKATDNIGKLAVGGLAAGAAAEGFARSQGDANATLRRAEIVTGLEEAALRSMIDELTNWTFSSFDATRAMDELIRRGYDTEEAFREILPALDDFGDATGTDLVAAASLFDNVLGALGIPLEDIRDQMDAFTYLASQTTVPLNMLEKQLPLLAGELQDLGLDTFDVAAAIDALGEQGYDGRSAMRLFNTAVKESEGDMGALLEGLGLTEAEFAGFREGVLEASDGLTVDFANANNSVATPAQRLESSLQNLAFRFGGVADMAGVVAGPLAAIGPSMMALNATQNVLSSGLGTRLVGALRVAGGAFRTLGTVILANPLFLIGALLIGIAVLIWKFRDEIIEALVGAWEWIKEKLGGVFDWFRNAISSVIAWVKENWTLILAIITGPIGLAIRWIIKNWDQLRETFTRIVSRIVDFVRNAFNNLRDTVTNAISSLRQNAIDRMTALVDWVRGLPRMLLDALGNVGRLLLDAGKNIIQGLWDGMREIWDRVTGWVGGLGDRIRNLKGPLSYDRVMLTDIGEAIIGGLGKGMEREWEQIEALLQSFNAEIPLNVSRDSLAGLADESTAAGSAMGSTVINYTVNNPTPEPASQSLSRDMRKLAAIGLFGG